MGSNRKMAIGILKINYKAQNKTWTNPQIKIYRKGLEIRLTRWQTQHKKSEHVYLKFWTSSVKKIVNFGGSSKFIYQEIQMYFLVSVDQTAWQCISPKVIVKKCLISIAVVRTNDNCGMAVMRMGLLGYSVQMMKTLTVKMELMTLIGKGRYNLMCFVYKCMQLIVKYFS
jgi:hypothetical protein